MRARTATTALLAVLALLATGCGVLGIGAAGTRTIDVEFSRTYNLFAGSPVRVLGIDVGRVRELRTSPGSDVVTVTLALDPDLQVPEDVRAVVVPEALLGERYVQLDPPWTGGPTLPDGATIPVERTQVPFEFDEVLEGLNDFVGGLDADEVGRFVANLAEVLDDNGAQLGRTIDSATAAIGVLAENDEEVIALASRLSDLNETLATRDAAIRRIIADWNTVTRSLADDRDDIDAALTGLVRLARQAEELLRTNRGTLTEDVATLTRVGRTAQRNLDQVSLAILGAAELFRHADRVVVQGNDNNWLPLVNHSDELANEITESLTERLVGLCLGAGLTPEQCAEVPIEDILSGDLCLPPLIPCATAASITLPEAVREIVTIQPEIGEELLRRRDLLGDDGLPAELGDAAEDALREIARSGEVAR
jgi:phospholipid/cholesterol/gamma-HCH transport system substrate-binding protein